MKKPPHCGPGSARKSSSSNNITSNTTKPTEPSKVHNGQQEVKQGINLKLESNNGKMNGKAEEDLKIVVEKQNELLTQQREDFEELKRKVEANLRITDDFRSELSEIRKNLQQNGDDRPNDPPEINNKIEQLASAYNDIQDRLYEIDKSWKNNLVVYGIPCSDNMDEDPLITEDKVRDVLQKKLHISREIPMSRISRIWHGPDFRGHKPIQICIVNYRDKEEILRKARLLKGSNIYISEDFSRKVREHRHELIKFMKMVRSRDPTRRMTLRYDKLYMGHHVFFFNDRTGKVERLHQNLDFGTSSNALIGNLILSDSQQASFNEPSWLRRPRSRQGSSTNGRKSYHSRNGTVLSRQNSVSMDDIHSSPPKTLLKPPRFAASAKTRRPPTQTTNGGVNHHSVPVMAKSTSMDFDYDSDGALSDSYFNSPSPTKGRNSYKTVVFKDVPELGKSADLDKPNLNPRDHQLKPILHPQQQNGTMDKQVVATDHTNIVDEEEEAIMTVDTVSKSITQTYSSTPVLPPIGQVMSSPYTYSNHMPMFENPETFSPANNFPAILHSSIGKLQMNFVQNRSLEEEQDKNGQKNIGYQEEHRSIEHLETGKSLIPANSVQEIPASHSTTSTNNGKNGIQQINGVLKVAMFGEFPISTPQHQAK